MDKLKRSLSFHKKRDSTPESSKPHQWQEDEKKVREGTCSFQVRYLGCIEVFESRGIQVCEEAIRGLKLQNKGKYQRTILYVSGDALRVVDEISKGLIVDQTIEKVSFCAPDRNNEKGFAYICRDGTTRRWMCHGFLALKESGERLSHAVGCAFTVCLEKKQVREKEKVTVTFNENGTSFTRTGSFRQTTMTERLTDPQSAIIAEPVPVKKSENLYEIQRPRASVDMLQRQNSFRGFSKLAETSPFKRQMSLRLDELSSTTDRLKRYAEEDGLVTVSTQTSHVAISPIMEASPMTEPTDSISQLCQQVTHDLLALTSDDPFLVVPSVARLGTGASTNQGGVGGTGNIAGNTAGAVRSLESQADTPHHSTIVNASLSGSALPVTASSTGEPIRQSNPWTSSPASHHSKVSYADFWLQSTANIIGQTRNPATGTRQPCVANGTMPQSSPYPGAAAPAHRPFAAGDEHLSIIQRAPHLTHFRAHSIDSAYSSQLTGSHQPGYQAFVGTQHQAKEMSTGQNHITRMWNAPAPGTVSMAGASQPAYDPFDAAWAAKVASRSTNPFHLIDSSNKSFEVKL